jgi:hypothetical protein
MKPKLRLGKENIRQVIYNCHRSFRKGVPNSGTGTGEEGFMGAGHKLVDPEVV